MTIAAQVETADRRERGIVSDALAWGVAFAMVLTLVQRGLGFIRGVLFCRLMSPEELGQFSLLSGALMMMAPLAVLGLPGTFGRFVEHYARSNQLSHYLRRIGRVCLLTSCALAAAMLVAPGFFSQQLLGEPDRSDLIGIAAIGLLLLTWCNYLTTLVEAFRQVRLASLMRFVSGITFTVGGVGLLLLLPEKATAAIIAFGVSSLLGALPAWFFLRSRRTAWGANTAALPAGEMWLRLAPFAGWWWLSNLLHNAYELADRYLLMHFGNLNVSELQAAVGQIHSSRVLPTLMVGVASMLSGLLMPYVTAAWVQGDRERARAQLNWTIKLSAVAIALANLGILLGAPCLFDCCLGGRYTEGLAILPFALVYCSWLSLLTVSQDYLWVAEKGKWAVGVMLAALLATIGLAAALIPIDGVRAAVGCISIGSLLALVGVYVCNQNMGCRPDRGVWMTLGAPLLVFGGPELASAATIGAGYLIVKTQVYFSLEEKHQICQMLNRRFRPQG